MPSAMVCAQAPSQLIADAQNFLLSPAIQSHEKMLDKKFLAMCGVGCAGV